MQKDALIKKINYRKMFADEQIFEGSIKVSDLNRLKLAVLNHDDYVTCKFKVKPESFNTKVTVFAEFSAVLKVVCQRCAEPMHIDISTDVMFLPVKNDEDAAKLPASVEPLLVDNGFVELWPCVEDELLLNIPYIPRHDEQVCKPAVFEFAPSAEDTLYSDEDNLEENENPFSILRDLEV